MKHPRLLLLLALLLLPAGCAAGMEERQEPSPAPGDQPSPSSATAPAGPAPESTPPSESEEPGVTPPHRPAEEPVFTASPGPTETSEAAPSPEAGNGQPPAPAPEPADDEFVRVRDYIPDIVVELPYATGDNFIGRPIYEFTDAWLRYGTVRRLAEVQDALREQGYLLKIWDAFRPPAAQFLMWEVLPDSTYVANPNRGFSKHSRGGTVDVTLVTADGGEVAMPTEYDDFSAMADRDYSDVDAARAANALLLERAMAEAGFEPYFGEWWHFNDSDLYEVEHDFLPPD